MSTWRMEGAATVAASLVHNGDREGTTAYFRTEKVILSDGSVTHVPIGSGNGLRGLLRDVSADLLWDQLGRPPLPTAVYHFLWSGGQLAKAGTTKVIGSRQLAALRALVPHVGLFGGAGAGRIIEGRLAVGKLVPIVTETAHLVPPDLLTGYERSINDYAQIEEFARRDDTHRAASAAAIDGGVPKQIGGSLLTVEEETPAGADGPAHQMRYGTQTLPMGLRLHWWMRLRDVSDLEAAWFAAVLAAWSADGATFGGRSATGHGRLILEHPGWVRAQPAITIGGDLPEFSLAEHVAAHREEILEHLRLVGS